MMVRTMDAMATALETAKRSQDFVEMASSPQGKHATTEVLQAVVCRPHLESTASIVERIVLSQTLVRLIAVHKHHTVEMETWIQRSDAMEM
jgi:hypothetical protein